MLWVEWTPICLNVFYSSVVAIYKFEDLTGQRKSRDGIADFSSAVTQAPEAYLIRALKQSGFFKVVERKGLDHLTKERQLIRQTRQSFEKVYIPNGYVDILNTSKIKKKNIYGDKMFVFITERTYEIDTKEDLQQISK